MFQIRLSGRLSESETNRIHRAFYRVEVPGNLYRRRPFGRVKEPLFCCLKAADEFFPGTINTIDGGAPYATIHASENTRAPRRRRTAPPVQFSRTRSGAGEGVQISVRLPRQLGG